MWRVLRNGLAPRLAYKGRSFLCGMQKGGDAISSILVMATFGYVLGNYALVKQSFGGDPTDYGHECIVELDARMVCRCWC